MALGCPVPTLAADGLDTVVVTARKRVEDAHSIPVALSVLEGRRLDDTGTVNVQQAALLVPSLYYNSANPRNTAYTIRGLGSNTLSISAANDGIEPGVGFYVDEVYHARPATASFDFTDIERIEILRGPQGTVYGKNTTAGAIHVLSRPPQFAREAYGELSSGGLNFFQTKVTLGGALGESVAARLSTQLTRRDGVIENVSTGDKLNAINNRVARAQLLYLPSENVKIRVIADVSEQNSACCTQSFLRIGQSLRGVSRQFLALSAGLGYRPPSLNIYDRVTDIDAPLRIDTQDGGLSVISEVGLRSGTLTSVTAWRYWDWDVANDRDFIGMPIQTVQRIPSRQDQYSEELRYTSGDAGRVRHVSGLFLFRQRLTGHPTSIYGSTAAYWLLNPSNFTVPIPRNLLDGYGQTGVSDFTLSSYAVFGEANLEVTSKMTATVGLRYTYEDKQGFFSTQVFGGADLSLRAPAVAAELERAKLSVLRPQAYEAAVARGNVSGRVNVAYQPSARLFAYVGFARGYKSGGLNMSGLPLDAQNRPSLATAVIRDELNETVETGVKSRWWGNRVVFDVAAYETRVADYQASIVSSVETAALRSYPANIPRVRVQGGEAELVIQPTLQLTLRGSLAYADGVNAHYPAGPCPLELQTAATIACDLTGARLAGLSRWSAALGVEYRVRVSRGEWLFAADTATRSRYNSDTSASKYTWVDGYSVTNARVSFKSDRAWQVDLFARNLLDENYLTALTIQAGNSGLILGQPSDPRLAGVAIRWMASGT